MDIISGYLTLWFILRADWVGQRARGIVESSLAPWLELVLEQLCDLAEMSSALGPLGPEKLGQIIGLFPAQNSPEDSLKRSEKCPKH